MRISIEGLIGCGKTTVARLLRGHYLVYEENTQSWEYWLEKKEEDPARWSFALQIKILSDMCTIPREAVSERSPFSARYVFVERLHDCKLITNEEYCLYLQVHEQLGWKPDIIIYIDTEPEICYQRILERNRKCETRITMDELYKLRGYHERMFRKASLPLLRVDGNQHPQEVAHEVKKILDGIKNSSKFLLQH